jgi:hypothetical protein
LFLSSRHESIPVQGFSAWTPDGNHVEEELGEFANLVVATESWHVFVGYYAKRRMTLRHGARVIRERIPANAGAPNPK